LIEHKESCTISHSNSATETTSSSSSSTTTTTTLPSPAPWLAQSAPVVQPRLNMKPLDSVPKLAPSFKAVNQQRNSAPVLNPVVVEEKPFVPLPLRTDAVDPYKAKTPKGWAQNGPNAKRPEKADDDNHQEASAASTFQVPTLRSVPVVAKPVEEKPVEISLPQLKPVEQVEGVKLQEPAAAEWQPPPLDTRRNLQALLERENQPVVAVTDADQVSGVETPRPGIQALLTKEMNAANVVASNGDDQQLAAEAELARLSVRSKIQRFEAANKTLTGTVALPTPVSSVRSSLASSPKVARKFQFDTQQQPQVKDRVPEINVKPAAVKIAKENAAPLPSEAPASAAVNEAEHIIQKIQVKSQTESIAQTSIIQEAPLQVDRQTAQIGTPLGKTASMTEMEMKRRSLADFTNHNTAPRGWLPAAMEIYRPVTFFKLA